MSMTESLEDFAAKRHQHPDDAYRVCHLMNIKDAERLSMPFGDHVIIRSGRVLGIDADARHAAYAEARESRKPVYVP